MKGANGQHRKRTGAGKTANTASPSWPLIGMDIDETAAALRVSRRVVQNALAAGKLPGRKIGNRWRVSPEALNAFLAGYEHTQREEDAKQAAADSEPEKGKRGRKKRENKQ